MGDWAYRWGNGFDANQTTTNMVTGWAYTGTAVTMTSAGVVTLPRLTWEDYWRLPERESAICPVCAKPAVVVDSVWICNVSGHHAELWRWPGVVGMD